MSKMIAFRSWFHNIIVGWFNLQFAKQLVSLRIQFFQQCGFFTSSGKDKEDKKSDRKAKQSNNQQEDHITYRLAKRAKELKTLIRQLSKQ